MRVKEACAATASGRMCSRLISTAYPTGSPLGSALSSAPCSAASPCLATTNASTGAPNPGCESTATPRPAASFDIFNYWSAQVGLQLTLLDAGRVYYGWRGARDNRAAAREGTDAALLQVTFDVRAA